MFSKLLYINVQFFYNFSKLTPKENLGNINLQNNEHTTNIGNNIKHNYGNNYSEKIETEMFKEYLGNIKLKNNKLIILPISEFQEFFPAFIQKKLEHIIMFSIIF